MHTIYKSRELNNNREHDFYYIEERICKSCAQFINFFLHVMCGTPYNMIYLILAKLKCNYFKCKSGKVIYQPHMYNKP